MSEAARPKLALRLWAQSHVAKVVGRSFVLLEVLDLVLCFNATGIACAVCEEGGMPPTAAGVPAPGGGHEPWPLLQLHREASGAACWASWAVGAESPTVLSVAGAQAIASKDDRKSISEAGRRMVVSAIHEVSDASC